MKRVLLLIGVFFLLYVVVGELRRTGAFDAGASLPVAFYILVPVLLFPLFLALSIRRNLDELGAYQVQPISTDAVSAEFRSRVADVEALGFQALGPAVALVARVPIRLQPFLSPDQLSYAAVFEHGRQPRVSHDFDSKLEDGRMVTTTSSEAAGRMPVRSTLLVQVFPTASPAELLKRHQEALAALGACERLGTHAEDYLVHCREAFRRQLQTLSLREMLALILPRATPHAVPIAARPKP